MARTQVEVDRAEMEEGLVAKRRRRRSLGDKGQARPLGLPGKKFFAIERSHMAFMIYGMLGPSACAMPFAKTLSLSFISLENVSPPFKTHLGVSFSELSTHRGAFPTAVHGAQLHRSCCRAGLRLCVCSPSSPTSWGAAEGQGFGPIQLPPLPSLVGGKF